MTTSSEQKRLISALLNMFKSVSETKCPTSGNIIIPQVCALLLSSGQIAGGVATNPVSEDNPHAEDAIQMAAEMANQLPGVAKDFKIVAVAMTTTQDEKSGQPSQIDLELYEQSLWSLPNLEAEELLLVEPKTEQTALSETFPEYGFAT